MRFIPDPIRRLIWFPFAVITCFPLMLAVLLLVLFYDRENFGWMLFTWLVAAGVSMPIEVKLRPHPGAPHMQMPKDRIFPTSFVGMVKRKAKPTGRSAILRGLSPALRDVLKQPANQKPSAILFDERRIAARNAPANDEQDAA